LIKPGQPLPLFSLSPTGLDKTLSSRGYLRQYTMDKKIIHRLK